MIKKKTKRKSPNPEGKNGFDQMLVRRALAIAAERVDPLTGNKSLLVAATMIMRKAMQGNIEAFKVIADRLDGKARQPVDIEGNITVSSIGQAHLEALQELTRQVQQARQVDSVSSLDLDSEEIVEDPPSPPARGLGE